MLLINYKEFKMKVPSKKDITPKQLLAKWKDANKKDYQKAIANNEFLHKNSAELVEIMESEGLEFNSLCEIGCGNGRNLWYIQQNFPDASYSGNDLDINQFKKHKPKSLVMDYSQADTLAYVTSKQSGFPDAVLESDHLMHIDPASVDEILETICNFWKPKYFVTRRPIVGRDNKMPYIWLHDYSVFEKDYDLKSFQSKAAKESKDYKIDIYTRRA